MLVQGYEIPFKSPPFQVFEPTSPKYSVIDEQLIEDSVRKLLKTGAISKSEMEEGSLCQPFSLYRNQMVRGDQF